MVDFDLSAARVYTDINGLAGLKRLAGQAAPAALQETADQFEAMFLNLLLQQMRKTTPGDSIFNTDNAHFYTKMMDSQIAVDLSKQGAIGIADMIVQQLQQHEIRHPDKVPASAVINTHDRIQAHNDKPKQQIAAIEFNSPQQFIDVVEPHAEIAAKKLALPAAILVAQAAFETSWGKNTIKNSDGSSTFNLLKVKAGNAWPGASVGVTTLEHINGTLKKQYALFRSYDSFQESFEDYVDFIKTNDYYSTMSFDSNGEHYIRALQQANYVTDPAYAKKIIDIAEHHLT